MVRRAGLDPDTVPWATAELALQRDPTRWLPLAMADLLSAVFAYAGGRPPTAAQFLRSWGLLRDADLLEEAGEEEREAAEEAALKRFFGG